MPTARLPDINTSFIRYRGEAIDGLRAREPERVLAALHALNALLPDELDADAQPRFRVIVNAAEYRRRTAHTLYVYCRQCGAEYLRADVKVYEAHLPHTVRVLTGKRTARVWRCEGKPIPPAPADATATAPDGKKSAAPAPAPKPCGREQRLDQTRMADRHPSEPHYCGAVPPPPERKPGLGGRTPYWEAFGRWAAMFLAELEAKMAAYRDAHWVRGNEDEDEGAYGPAFGSDASGRTLEEAAAA